MTTTPPPVTPCESCQHRPAVVTVPGNHAAWNTDEPPYPIQLCAGCAHLVPEGQDAIRELVPQTTPL